MRLSYYYSIEMNGKMAIFGLVVVVSTVFLMSPVDAWRVGKYGVFVWEKNCNFVAGNVQDIAVVKSAKNNCGLVCQLRGGCTHFTWNGKCILKKASASEKFSYLKGVICGKLKNI